MLPGADWNFSENPSESNRQSRAPADARDLFENPLETGFGQR